jgi:hypothetical protein
MRFAWPFTVRDITGTLLQVVGAYPGTEFRLRGFRRVFCFRFSHYVDDSPNNNNN